MDIVSLPLLSIDTPLRDARAAMKAAQCSAVVAMEDGDLWLFKAGAIIPALRSNKRTLGDLEWKWPVHTASDTQVARHGLDLLNPRSTPLATETLLDQMGRLYLFGGPQSHSPAMGVQMATFITRHEKLARQMGNGPADCYCTNPALGDEPHDYYPPVPQICPLDNFPVVCTP